MAKIIDLSRPIETGMPLFPAIFTTYVGIYRGHADTIRPGGISSCQSFIVMSDHAGTHLDASLHFDPKGMSIDKAPLDIMYGPAVVFDFSYKSARDSILREEVENQFLSLKLGPREVKVVLIRTGADHLYGKGEYFGHYLEIKRETVIWLLDQGIKVFGVDAGTIDHAQDRGTHMLLREQEFYHIENLTNLDKLGNSLFTFVGFPLKFMGAIPPCGTIRAVAILPD